MFCECIRMGGVPYQTSPWWVGRCGHAVWPLSITTVQIAWFQNQVPASQVESSAHDVNLTMSWESAWKEKQTLSLHEWITFAPAGRRKGVRTNPKCDANHEGIVAWRSVCPIEQLESSQVFWKCCRQGWGGKAPQICPFGRYLNFSAYRYWDNRCSGEIFF